MRSAPKVWEQNQLHHIQAMSNRGDVKVELVGWQTGWHKYHVLQSLPHPHFLGSDQVADVNGIKSAAQNSYPHEQLLRQQRMATCYCLVDR